jgi:hypothetical protein
LLSCCYDFPFDTPGLREAFGFERPSNLTRRIIQARCGCAQQVCCRRGGVPGCAPK